MAQRRIYITRNHARKLKDLLQRELYGNGHETDALLELQKELRRAKIVSSEEAPHEVITMYSSARLKDLRDDDLMEMTLVFPEEADPSSGRISVMAPIGTAILGCKEGDTVKLRTPGRSFRLYIEQVTDQPKAAGQLNTSA